MCNQEDVIAFLSSLSAAASPLGEAEIIETHAAIVFLVGDEALKLKKSVDLGYLDFTSLEKRKAACLSELKINQPNAPQIYCDVATISRDRDGQLIFGSSEADDAEVCDYIIRMRRFDQNRIFSELAKEKRLRQDLLVCTARMVAKMHSNAKQYPHVTSRTNLQGVAAKIATSFQHSAPPDLQATAAACMEPLLKALATQEPRLIDRCESGLVRWCHGDLHLRNLVLLDDDPVAFDALEFDEELAKVDVLYDLSFLLMDLLALGDTKSANIIVNTYLAESGEPRNYSDLALVPLFIALRAMIRAMVAQTQCTQHTENSGSKQNEAKRYIQLVQGVLRPEAASLIVVAGASGTGKSTLARALAASCGHRLGAIHLRSDEIRKELAGVSVTTRLSEQYYTADTSRRVYEELRARAGTIAAAGFPVVVDAVFGTSAERDAIKRVAAVSGVSFKPIWLVSDVDTLKDRVKARRGDASDATVAVVEHQALSVSSPDDWPHIDTSHSIDETLKRVRAALATTA